MTLTLDFPNAVHADAFTEHGGTWEPDCHWIVPTHEPIEAEFVQRVLNKYSEHVVAFAAGAIFDDQTICLELQFADPDIGSQCNKEYLQGFRKGGAVTMAKKAQSKKPTKRLYKHRMYRLPNGELFWYFDLWDRHGNLIGKVTTATEDRLENRIVHRSVLEQCECIPKGREPWLPG